MKIIIDNISKSFKDKIVFKDFSIAFSSDKINCILGKSGGGKSTLLNMISGIETIDSGNIIGVDTREVSYIFQEDILVPWLTIKKNIELFLYNYYDKSRGIDILNLYASILQINDALDLYPNELSGGMKQRVNILRALVKPSKAILMDEPFKSLDYNVKYDIMIKLKEIFSKENRIIIFVTHDIDEAIFMNGNVFILGGNPFNLIASYSDNLSNHKKDMISLI